MTERIDPVLTIHQPRVPDGYIFVRNETVWWDGTEVTLSVYRTPDGGWYMQTWSHAPGIRYD